jgi:hypothetical protein
LGVPSLVNLFWTGGDGIFSLLSAPSLVLRVWGPLLLLGPGILAQVCNPGSISLAFANGNFASPPGRAGAFLIVICNLWHLVQPTSAMVCLYPCWSRFCSPLGPPGWSSGSTAWGIMSLRTRLPPWSSPALASLALAGVVLAGVRLLSLPLQWRGACC